MARFSNIALHCWRAVALQRAFVDSLNDVLQLLNATMGLERLQVYSIDSGSYCLQLLFDTHLKDPVWREKQMRQLSATLSQRLCNISAV